MRRAHRSAVLVVALMNALVLAAGVAFAAVGLPGAEYPRVVERDPVRARPVLPPSFPRQSPTTPAAAGAVAETAVTQALRSSALGSSVAAMVVDPFSGKALLRRQAKQPATPASTTKILTAAAALHALGPDARLTTKVVRSGGSQTVTLVGGGDPTLASPEAERAYPRPARLGALARKTAASLRESGVTAIRLRYDVSLFSGPVTARTWKAGYVPNGYVAPVTALSVDSGRADPADPGALDPGPSPRVSDPPRAAATLFATLLEDEGITVRGEVAERAAPDGARRVAAVRSPAVSVLVEQMLTNSDNDLAEALGRHVALAVGTPPSFSGASAAVERVLARIGVPTQGIRLYDCSGLSHENTLTARALARVLAKAASPGHAALRSVLTGLPVAGYTGTLGKRYAEGAAADTAGFVRAKTGTLNHVTTLAGVAYRPDGRMVVFAVLANEVPLGATRRAEAALDQLAATLARPTRG